MAGMGLIGTNVMYLESYIESTATLPSELQRILYTIKALDEKCLYLSSELQAGVGNLHAMPPQYLQPAGQSQEYIDLNKKVLQDQKMLLQFADEKVQLAQQAHDLLEVHALELERVMDDLDKELVKSNPNGSGLDYLGEPLDSMRGKTPKLEEWPPPPEPLPAPQQLMPLPPMAPLPGQKRGGLPMPVQKITKRIREEDLGVQPLKKKASTMAMQMNVPASYEDYMNPNLSSGYEEPQDKVPFMRAPPVGYKASATRPQAPGRYLGEADIGHNLVGRHAELFWPDDNLWYLIEIQEVYVESKTAKVLYSTGDFETLSLEETAKDMHMMFIPEHLY